MNKKEKEIERLKKEFDSLAEGKDIFVNFFGDPISFRIAWESDTYADIYPQRFQAEFECTSLVSREGKMAKQALLRFERGIERLKKELQKYNDRIKKFDSKVEAFAKRYRIMDVMDVYEEYLY
jgi:hypothetical protein